jgi:tetratricopeptide (TPR) repeat protein
MIGAVRGIVVCACLAAVVSTAAQDLDTVIFSEGRRQTTILDEVGDRGERKAFLKLYKEHNPTTRRSLATKFLADYPASWLLAEVYEIAAKACIDLKETDCALEMGERSLRLLPENPLLLVPLATVQLQRGLVEKARESASDALDLLDRFAAPAGSRPNEWSKVAQELRASSYYALGRVYSMQGLAESGANRKRLLERALGALDHAIALSPNDTELVYLRGLMLLALGRARESSVDFRAAAARPSPVQDRARAQLKKLNLREDEGGTASAERMATSVPSPSPSPAAEYAGSKACKSCHATEFGAWERTGMAKMLRPYRPENVIGDFTSQRQFAGRNGDAVVSVKVERDQHVFQIRAQDGVWHRYPVDYTIGSKWQQAYATRLADGRIQVFPIQYNVLKHEWINYWQRIDPVGSERADITGFSKMPESANFQRNCAPCHTSQLRTGPNNDLNHASFLEGGINCEMCHGPSAAHAAGKQEGRTYNKRPADPPVDFPKIGNRDAVRICAQCHMQSAIREHSNDAAGEFFPRYLQRPYQEFLRKAFYKDGRFRETTFIVEAFVRSQCFRKGQAQCGHCHNPHQAGQDGNHTSFKFAAAPDEMCLQCHTEYRDGPERHTHHRAASDGSRCQACHMPHIMNSLLFQARSHQIDDIPSAEPALRFGQNESPIACLECHSTKDVPWVQAQLRSWSEVRSVSTSHAAR